MEQQQSLVQGLKDPVREGFHWAWHGCALWHRHRFAESYQSLIRAKELGEKADNADIIGYACSWLSWPCTELGRFDEALENSELAEALYINGRAKDTYIYFHALLSKGYTYWHKGDVKRTSEIGDRLLKFGHRHGNVRSLVSGYSCQGWKDLITGDIQSATESFKKAVRISADPWYSLFPKLALCYGTISNGLMEEALPLLDKMTAFSDDNGAEFIGEPARFFKGMAEIFEGRTQEGLKSMEGLLERWKTEGSRLRTMTCGYVMARTYSQLFETAQKSSPPTASEDADRLGEKAVLWFQTCIGEATKMGAVAMEGQALLALGKTFILMGRPVQARDALTQSIISLEQVHATTYLNQAREQLASL